MKAGLSLGVNGVAMVIVESLRASQATIPSVLIPARPRRSGRSAKDCEGRMTETRKQKPSRTYVVCRSEPSRTLEHGPERFAWIQERGAQSLEGGARAYRVDRVDCCVPVELCVGAHGEGPVQDRPSLQAWLCNFRPITFSRRLDKDSKMLDGKIRHGYTGLAVSGCLEDARRIE
jgi:hypothetical protein